jgi:hypothetical protein
MATSRFGHETHGGEYQRRIEGESDRGACGRQTQTSLCLMVGLVSGYHDTFSFRDQTPLVSCEVIG